MPQSIDRDRFGFLANPKNWVLRSIALSWCSTAGKGSRDYRFARQRGDACGASRHVSERHRRVSTVLDLSDSSL
jgi:hypothetical protein